MTTSKKTPGLDRVVALTSGKGHIVTMLPFIDGLLVERNHWSVRNNVLSETDFPYMKL